MTQMTITIMTNATTTCSAIKPSISNMSNIIKSVANIQHTIHIRSAIAAILITYDKHPLIIVCFSAFKLIICHPKNLFRNSHSGIPYISTSPSVQWTTLARTSLFQSSCKIISSHCAIEP